LFDRIPHLPLSRMNETIDRIHTSSVTQILFDERGNGLATPRCIMMSALPHLYANSIEPGTAGIKANYA
jgi:hypothetical protein